MRHRTITIPIFAVALAFGAAACAPEAEDAGVAGEVAETPAAVPSAAATAPLGYGDLRAGLDSYVGQTVTVEAEVDEVLGPMVFRIDDELAAGITDDLLVVSPQAAQLAPLEDQWLNDRVRITGTIWRGTVVDLERELGWDLQSELEAEIDTRPVLVASVITRVTDS